MFDPDAVLDYVVDTLRLIPTLVPTLFTSGQVAAYHHEPPKYNSVTEAILQARAPAICAVYMGFGATSRDVFHQIGLYVFRNGKAGQVLLAIRDGVPSNSGGLKFKLAGNANFYQPDTWTMGTERVLTVRDSFLDIPLIRFRIVEKGLDN